MHEEIIQIHRPRLAGYIHSTLRSATSFCERERTLVPLLLKSGSCCCDSGCEMAVVAFTITTVSLIISFSEYNECRSALTARNGFSITSIEVTKALTCLSKANSTAGTCPKCLIALSQQLAVNMLLNYVRLRVLDNSSAATIQRVNALGLSVRAIASNGPFTMLLGFFHVLDQLTCQMIGWITRETQSSLLGTNHVLQGELGRTYSDPEC